MVLLCWIWSRARCANLMRKKLKICRRPPTAGSARRNQEKRAAPRGWNRVCPLPVRNVDAPNAAAAASSVARAGDQGSFGQKKDSPVNGRIDRRAAKERAPVPGGRRMLAVIVDRRSSVQGSGDVSSEKIVETANLGVRRPIGADDLSVLARMVALVRVSTAVNAEGSVAAPAKRGF